MLSFYCNSKESAQVEPLPVFQLYNEKSSCGPPGDTGPRIWDMTTLVSENTYSSVIKHVLLMLFNFKVGLPKIMPKGWAVREMNQNLETEWLSVCSCPECLRGLMHHLPSK
jgi:hypothetical protein